MSGCASFPWFGQEETKPLVVETKPLEKTPLDIALPDPLVTKPIEWIVITPENAEDVFKKLEAKGSNLVLFALTDDGYQQLALTMSEIRKMIINQRGIIIKYKEYYEPKKQ